MNTKPQDSFRSRLREQVNKLGTSLCVGCDPHTNKLPPLFAETLRRDGAAVFLTQFTRTLIDASVGIAPAVKLQSAFYEAHGSAGFKVLAEMVAYARSRGLLTVLDAKRGDIASTMTAYGQMAFAEMGADALTVTPYMGLDTIEPLLPWLTKGHGVYIVWVSSNPGGALLQDCLVEGPDGSKQPMSTLLFKAFGDYLSRHGAQDAFGVVLGATRVEALAPTQYEKLAQASLLMPGIGAQGGTITPIIRKLMADRAALIPQSRSLSAADATLKSWPAYLDLVGERIVAAAREVAV